LNLNMKKIWIHWKEKLDISQMEEESLLTNNNKKAAMTMINLRMKKLNA
jgi:hypothetical protein